MAVGLHYSNAKVGEPGFANVSDSLLDAKPYTAPAREIWAWGVGAIACHALIQTYGQANIIFTVGFGLSPVIISWCMMLPRVVDGVMDPIIGHLSDDTHTRWGRRKPYLVIGALFGSIFLAAVWWASPSWSHAAQFAYLLVLGTLFYIAYGVYTMAWTAVGYELTDDYHERSKVAAIGGLFLAIVALSAGWMYWFALRPSLFRNEIIGMRWISAGVGVVILVSALVATLGCRERFTHTNRKHVPVGPALMTTARNRPFVILLLIKICQILGDRAAGGLLTYLAIYYVCNGDKSVATKIVGLGGTIGTIWGFAALPAMKPISQWLGKRGALIIGASVSFAAALAQPFILSPGHPYLLLLPALVVVPLMTISNTLANAIVPDICDVDELESGQRREGLFTSVMGFMAKMEISLCFLLVGYLLSWSGLDTKLSTQPPHVLHRLFWLCVLPNIFFAFLGLLLTIKFPMTEAGMTEVRRQLDARRIAKAAAGEPTDEVAEALVHEHPEVAAAQVSLPPREPLPLPLPLPLPPHDRVPRG